MSELRAGRYVQREGAWHDTLLDVPVSVDVQDEGTDAAAALLHRARVAARVRHPGLAPVLDLGVEDGRVWAVSSARGFVELQLHSEPMRIVDRAGELGEALHALHSAGGVHGDVRPGTIEVSEGQLRLKGLEHARIEGLEPPSSAERGPFTAPEVRAGEPPTAASDQYALSACLVWCLTGELPDRIYQHPEGSPIWAPIPEPTRSILRRAVSRDPSARYGSVVEFVAALGRGRAGREASGDAPVDKAGAAPRILIATQDSKVEDSILQDLGGVETRVAHTADEMKASLESYTPHLLLVDVDVTGGLELVRGLHALYPDVAIIAVLGRDHPDLAKAWNDPAIEQSLLKPLASGRVLKEVSAALKQRGIEVVREAARVVLVEDDATQASLLLRFLKRESLTPTVYDTGLAALEDDGPSPAVYILDIGLPDISGLEVLRRIRLDPKRGSVPILVLSAKDQAPDVVRALDLGADDYLAKPYAPAELLARVRRLLKPRS